MSNNTNNTTPRNFEEAVSLVAKETGYSEEYIIDNELVQENHADGDWSEFEAYENENGDLVKPEEPIGYTVCDNESETFHLYNGISDDNSYNYELNYGNYDGYLKAKETQGINSEEDQLGNQDVKVMVFGIQWDADSKDELDGVSTTVEFTMPLDEFNEYWEYEDEDGFEEHIADKISDISGFCHDGWDEYKIVKEKDENGKKVRFVRNPKSGPDNAFYSLLDFTSKGSLPYIGVELLSDGTEASLEVTVSFESESRDLLKWSSEIGGLNVNMDVNDVEVDGEYLHIKTTTVEGHVFHVQCKSQEDEKGLIIDVFKNDEEYASLGYLTEEDFQ